MTPNQVDAVDELLQQMLVDYTAWVNGEPIAWNVKKAEARAKLNALLVAAERDGIIWATGASSLSPEDIKIFQDRIKALEKLREADNG